MSRTLDPFTKETVVTTTFAPADYALDWAVAHAATSAAICSSNDTVRCGSAATSSQNGFPYRAP